MRTGIKQSEWVKRQCHVYTKRNEDLPTLEPGTLTYACNHSTQKTEAGRIL